MKLYRIANWNELYENNRSRKVGKLAWVPMPNRHDGENYTTIVTHRDGAILLSAWVLIVQVASKCQPRGTLVRDNGTPHNSASLAAKTRAPQNWFDLALGWLEANTDWLDYQDDAGGWHRGGIGVASKCHEGDEEQKEQKELKKGVFDESKTSVGLELELQQSEKPEQTDDEWLAYLGQSEAYAGIDVRQQYSRMVAWCGVNKKKPTRRRFINWLNRCDKPMGGATGGGKYVPNI